MNRAALLGMLAALSGVALAGSSGLLISRAALRPEVFLSLTLLVTTVRALGLGRAALRYAERLIGHAAALTDGEGTRLRLFDTFARFGRDLLVAERSGDLLARSGADLDAQQFHALRVRLPLWVFVGVLLGLTGWLLWFDLPLTLIALLPLAATAGSVLGVRGRAAELARDEAALTRDHATRLLDALSASGDGAERHHAPELERLAGRLRQVARQAARLTWQTSLVREAGFMVAVTGVLWRGAALMQAGVLPGPLLAAVVLAVAAAFDAAAPLAAVPAAHAANEAALRRQAVLVQLAPVVSDPLSPQATNPDGADLTLTDVSVVRQGRTILRDVSLRLKVGAQLSISGSSGGGKTTLLRLLTRDLDPDAGQVALGGLDLRALCLTDLRAMISIHEQDAPLLDGTVRENLLLGDRQAQDHRLRGLLDDLALCHLPLDSWVGEGGTRLSGGERARVCLARALLKPSDHLLLDEPTAHLDAETEARVLRVIEQERRGRGLLIVTHRQAPLALTEHRFTLAGGRLTETRPTPDALSLTNRSTV